MLVHIFGAKCVGIDAVQVTVEIDIAMGIGIHLCGLGDAAVKESLLRTITALQALGYHIPGKKIVINLAPADMHKSGSGYDLPIAIGIIAASEQKVLPLINNTLIMGELGLDGSIRTIRGGLPIADFAQKTGYARCILPYESALEAKSMDGIQIYGVKNLNEVVSILEGIGQSDNLIINDGSYKRELNDNLHDFMDFSEIIGQEGAKRAMEIAASGVHNIILMGAPGSGKSSLAKALAGILPPMTKEESFVCSKIYSIAGLGDLTNGLMSKRPFRNPHYSASLAALIGGGNGTENIIPGEVTLAHQGVLFLDEFNLMPKSITEALRAPLEDRKVIISRLRNKVEYPASFTLVTAVNPCPCGYYGEGNRCTCTPAQRNLYLKRLSGPILDRMDLQVIVHPIAPGTLKTKIKTDNSTTIAARVLRTRAIQQERFKNTDISSNAEMTNKIMEKLCPLSKECENLMQELMEKLSLSMRAYFRIIKVARTIADMEEKENIETQHLLEAAGYRFLDRQNLL